MEINITTTKTKALFDVDPNVTKEFIKVEISDQDLLKLGRRYFELSLDNHLGGADVGGDTVGVVSIPTVDDWKEKELKEDPAFTREYMINAAKNLKAYCKGFISCKTCPFCMNPSDEDRKGIYKCALHGQPDSWEV